MGLDPEIKALLRESITWERCTGQDVYSNETYAPARLLACRIEADTVAERSADTVVMVPAQRVYLDASDRHVQQITKRDRFTPPGQDATERVQPKSVETKYGPGGDKWLIVVTL